MIRRCSIEDRDMVTEVLRSDCVFDSMKDDFCKNKEDVDAIHILSDKMTLVISNNDQVFMMFRPLDPIVYEAHVFCCSEVRGRRAVKMVREILEWAYGNTNCKKLIGFTPEWNKRAISFSGMVGFQHTGVLKRSALKDGVWYDEIITQHDKELLNGFT